MRSGGGACSRVPISNWRPRCRPPRRPLACAAAPDANECVGTWWNNGLLPCAMITGLGVLDKAIFVHLPCKPTRPQIFLSKISMRSYSTDDLAIELGIRPRFVELILELPGTKSASDASLRLRAFGALQAALAACVGSVDGGDVSMWVANEGLPCENLPPFQLKNVLHAAGVRFRKACSGHENRCNRASCRPSPSCSCLASPICTQRFSRRCCATFSPSCR